MKCEKLTEMQNKKGINLKKRQKKPIQQNNAGMTMVELTVTFAILGLLLVACTRIISYTITIYYNSKAASYGLEVSNMIANQIAGSVEGAKSVPVISADGTTISFVDKTDSPVTIGTVTLDGAAYLNIHYEPANYLGTEYEATDFRFDEKTYMGFEIQSLVFSRPDADKPEELREYPSDVIRMDLVLKSERYGYYESTRYMKCVNAK